LFKLKIINAISEPSLNLLCEEESLTLIKWSDLFAKKTDVRTVLKMLRLCVKMGESFPSIRNTILYLNFVNAIGYSEGSSQYRFIIGHCVINDYTNYYYNSRLYYNSPR